MSGPIVRKYGFPNFDKIFGERPLEHGVEESEQPESRAEDPGGATGKREEPTQSKDSSRKQPKSS